MSFTRFGPGSDLYVFASSGGGVECCGCILPVGVYEAEETYTDFLGLTVHHKVGDPVYDSRHFYDIESLFEHYREHEVAGHDVPKHLFDREQYEESDFDEVRTR